MPRLIFVGKKQQKEEFESRNFGGFFVFLRFSDGDGDGDGGVFNCFI